VNRSSNIDGTESSKIVGVDKTPMRMHARLARETGPPVVTGLASGWALVVGNHDHTYEYGGMSGINRCTGGRSSGNREYRLAVHLHSV
jgi:hypothetical protein